MALDRPYFLWLANATVGDLRRHLSSESTEERAYWLGALLREANTRDVWLYTAPEEIRSIWPAVARHLGKSRAMWIYLWKFRRAGQPMSLSWDHRPSPRSSLNRS